MFLAAGNDDPPNFSGAEGKENVEVILSSEHDEFKWLTKDEAINYLKWSENRAGLLKLGEIMGK